MQSGYGLTFSKLRHLVAVAEALNLTKAAENLHISQPALSRSIISIERDYGLAIFERLPSGVALTSVGAAVVEEARAVLERIRSYEHTLRLYGAGEEGDISFGTTPQLASLILPVLATKMLGKMKKVSWNVLIRPTDILLTSLRNDEIEFCVTAEERSRSPNVTWTEIGRLSAAFFARREHPLAGRGEVSWDDLSDFTIGCSEEVEPPAMLKNELRLFLCDNFDILKKISLSSDMICLCSRSFAFGGRGSDEMVEIPVKPIGRFSHPIRISNLNGMTLSPATRIVKDYISDIFSEIDNY